MLESSVLNLSTLFETLPTPPESMSQQTFDTAIENAYIHPSPIKLKDYEKNQLREVITKYEKNFEKLYNCLFENYAASLDKDKAKKASRLFADFMKDPIVFLAKHIYLAESSKLNNHVRLIETISQETLKKLEKLKQIKSFLSGWTALAEPFSTTDYLQFVNYINQGFSDSKAVTEYERQKRLISLETLNLPIEKWPTKELYEFFDACSKSIKNINNAEVGYLNCFKVLVGLKKAYDLLKEKHHHLLFNRLVKIFVASIYNQFKDNPKEWLECLAKVPYFFENATIPKEYQTLNLKFQEIFAIHTLKNFQAEAFIPNLLFKKIVNLIESYHSAKEENKQQFWETLRSIFSEGKSSEDGDILLIAALVRINQVRPSKMIADFLNQTKVRDIIRGALVAKEDKLKQIFELDHFAAANFMLLNIKLVLRKEVLGKQLVEIETLSEKIDPESEIEEDALISTQVKTKKTEATFRAKSASFKKIFFSHLVAPDNSSENVWQINLLKPVLDYCLEDKEFKAKVISTVKDSLNKTQYDVFCRQLIILDNPKLCQDIFLSLEADHSPKAIIKKLKEMPGDALGKLVSTYPDLAIKFYAPLKVKRAIDTKDSASRNWLASVDKKSDYAAAPPKDLIFELFKNPNSEKQKQLLINLLSFDKLINQFLTTTPIKGSLGKDSKENGRFVLQLMKNLFIIETNLQVECPYLANKAKETRLRLIKDAELKHIFVYYKDKHPEDLNYIFCLEEDILLYTRNLFRVIRQPAYDFLKHTYKQKLSDNEKKIDSIKEKIRDIQFEKTLNNTFELLTKLTKILDAELNPRSKNVFLNGIQEQLKNLLENSVRANLLDYSLIIMKVCVKSQALIRDIGLSFPIKTLLSNLVKQSMKKIVELDSNDFQLIINFTKELPEAIIFDETYELNLIDQLGRFYISKSINLTYLINEFPDQLTKLIDWRSEFHLNPILTKLIEDLTSIPELIPAFLLAVDIDKLLQKSRSELTNLIGAVKKEPLFKEILLNPNINIQLKREVTSKSGDRVINLFLSSDSKQEKEYILNNFTNEMLEFGSADLLNRLLSNDDFKKHLISKKYLLTCSSGGLTGQNSVNQLLKTYMKADEKQKQTILKNNFDSLFAYGNPAYFIILVNDKAFISLVKKDEVIRTKFLQLSYTYTIPEGFEFPILELSFKEGEATPVKITMPRKVVQYVIQNVELISAEIEPSSSIHKFLMAFIEKKCDSELSNTFAPYALQHGSKDYLSKALNNPTTQKILMEHPEVLKACKFEFKEGKFCLISQPPEDDTPHKTAVPDAIHEFLETHKKDYPNYLDAKFKPGAVLSSRGYFKHDSFTEASKENLSQPNTPPKLGS